MIYISIFNVHLFFIISGYLLKKNKEKYTKKNIKEIIKSKFKKLMIPYIIYGIMNIIGNYIISSNNVPELKNNIILFITLFGVGAMWFLPALCIGEVGLIILTHSDKSINKIFYIILINLVFSISYYIFKENYSWNLVFWIITRFIISFDFIVIGYYLYDIINNIREYKKYIILILLILTYSLANFNGKISLWRVDFGKSIFLAIVLSICICILLIIIFRDILNRDYKVLLWINKNSILILCTHQMIIRLIGVSSESAVKCIIYVIITIFIEYLVIICLDFIKVANKKHKRYIEIKGENNYE